MAPSQSPDNGSGADGPQTHAQRAANLARIRDNQRRSRARRKEYLQELETKYRQCEQVGAEASAEIQAAARRVIDENRRLRALLKQQGLTDAEIDAISAESPQLPATANALEGMIAHRRTCGPDSECGTGSIYSMEEGRDRGQSCAPSLPSQSQSEAHAPALPSQSADLQNAVMDPHFSSPHPSLAAGLHPQSSVPYPAMQPPTQRPLYSTNDHMAHHPVIDNDFAYDDDSFSWLSHYQASNVATAATPSTHMTADTLHPVHQGFDYELSDQLQCGNCNECSVPHSGP